MKISAKIWLKKVCALAIVMCFVLSPWETMHADAASARSFDSTKDVDYTGGEGAGIVLEHKGEGTPTATYEVNDSRLTRNATFYMSMQVKFSKSHSWVIRLRNASCKIKGETVTGNMQFHLFANKGTLQVGGKGVGAKSWSDFKNVEDNKWHTVVVRSTPDSFELWVDGDRANALYLNQDVSDLTSNYACPAVTMAGYNEGTIKNICVWNNGADENPVMPADRVVQKIESLPDTVSLKASDASNVQKAKEAYDALSDTEKAYVTNYDKLQQLLKTSGSGEKNYYVEVSGTEEGAFSEVFPDGVISHRKESTEKFLFESNIGRTATYYIQFVVNMAKDSNCFDVVLRNQQHTVDGKSVTGNISLRMFKRSAVVLDSRQNRLSDWVNYATNIYEGSHVITVESSPTSLTLWIDEVKYEVPDYMTKISGKPDCIQTVTGFTFSKDQAEGTISNIRVWSNQNTYAVGDKIRVAIFDLPKLKDVTLADAGEIGRIRESYDALSKEQQKYVPNYNKLERLERAIAFLREKGDAAYLFLKDEVPGVRKDYVNLISTGTLNVPAANRNMVDYDALNHKITFKEAGEYVTTPFDGIEGIKPDDTYLIKFTYIPYEYYYETPTAGWMGLRITFSGYTIGGNGQKTRNSTQFAFMTRQCAKLSWANNNAAPTDYLTTFEPELNKEYQVTMLCEQGKMKLWINGEPVVYYDELPEYPFLLEFESSRVRCDVKDIQLYNLSNPTEPELEEAETESFKLIGDTLYDVKGISAQDRVDAKKKTFVIALVLLLVVAAITVVVFVFNLKKKSFRKKTKGEEAVYHDKKENS